MSLLFVLASEGYHSIFQPTHYLIDVQIGKVETYDGIKHDWSGIVMYLLENKASFVYGL